MSAPSLQVRVPALVILLVALAAVLPEGPFYLTNDDVAMRLLAEGRFAPGTGPVPFLLFMNVALGALLAALYRVASVVPWYDLLILLTMVMSGIVLVAVWMAANTWTARIGACLLAVFFLMPVFATPQFSMAGMTAATAGLVLLARPLTVLLDDDARRRHLRWGVMLLVWGALIRWEAAVLLLCQAAISVAVLRLPVLRAQNPGGDRPRSGRQVARAVAIAMVLMAIAFAINLGAYRATPGWRDFPQFNLSRARLGEYASTAAPSEELLAALRRETGWSANDLSLLRDFFFLDATVFTLDKFGAAQAVFAEHTAPRPASAVTAAERQVRQRVLSNWAALSVLAAVVLAVALAGGPAGARPRPSGPIARRVVILVWLVGAMYGMLIVITATLKDAPYHLYWPMLVLVAGLLPLGRSQDPSPSHLPSNRRGGRDIAAALLLIGATVVVAFAMRDLWAGQRERRAIADALAADVTALRGTGASLIGIHATALRWEYFWKPFRQADPGIPFIGIGASGQTPPIQDALARYEARDFVLGLCSHDRWLLLAQPPLLPKLSMFMAEHHQRTAAFEPVLEGRTFTAWRCRVE